MKTEKYSFDVPADVMTAIAGIILKNGLAHRITDCDQERDTIQMEIFIPENKPKVLENVEVLIDNYNYFRYGD